jgi:hypothetical protein
VRVHVARIEDGGAFTDLPVDRLLALARLDRMGLHELVGDPDLADLVLFTQCHMVDWRLGAIRNHPLVRRHPTKVAVYDERDRPWRSFPGVYVSVPASTFDRRSQRAWGYLQTPEVAEMPTDPDLLFSFVGSPTASCREPLFGLRHPDAVVEEVRDFMFWDEERPHHDAHRRRFLEVLSRSRFVLCPRGRGTSSFRLYETLALGRVPVIISDEWQRPAGPDWNACAIFWPEDRIDGLVERLEDCDRDWRLMSAAARATHADYFADDVVFHHVVDLCASARRSAGIDSRRRLAVRSLVGAGHERITNR